MKRLLTVLPGALLAMALVSSTPAMAADRDLNHASTPSAQRATAEVLPVADHAGPRGAPEMRGDRDFDRGFNGGFAVVGPRFFDPFWPGFGWGAPYGYWGYWGPYDGYYGYHYSGGLKLKVTGPDPKKADVYADGSYVGTVDDFNGTFQRLSLRPGPYTIEIRAKGYRPLTLKVRIQPDRTITYRAEMQKIA